MLEQGPGAAPGMQGHTHFLQEALQALAQRPPAEPPAQPGVEVGLITGLSQPPGPRTRRPSPPLQPRGRGCLLASGCRTSGDFPRLVERRTQDTRTRTPSHPGGTRTRWKPAEIITASAQTRNSARTPAPSHAEGGWAPGPARGSHAFPIRPRRPLSLASTERLAWELEKQLCLPCGS